MLLGEVHSSVHLKQNVRLLDIRAVFILFGVQQGQHLLYFMY
jgi:hypothetical protein